jgi:DNA repair exonuclease SbcCD ATPase subunit
MDLKTAITLGTRRYLAPTVIVLLLLASGMSHVWGEYKDLLRERKSLNDEIVHSERNRADASIALIAQKAELDKREFVLLQLEGQNKEKLSSLQQRASEYEAAFGKLQQAQSSVSQAQRQKEVEDKLQALMSEFSAMGVNLSDSLRCGDVDGQTRYNAAKAKYSEIYTLAEANGMKKRFSNFLFHNGHFIEPSCQK